MLFNAKVKRLLMMREHRSKILSSQVLSDDEVKLTVMLNVPGLSKKNWYLHRFYLRVIKKLEQDWLGRYNYKVKSFVYDSSVYDWKLYIIESGDSVLLKQRLLEWEGRNQCFRFVDFDIYTNDGKVGRSSLGQNERQCFLCDRPAKLCARESRHNLREIRCVMHRMIKSDKIK